MDGRIEGRTNTLQKWRENASKNVEACQSCLVWLRGYFNQSVHSRLGNETKHSYLATCIIQERNTIRASPCQDKLFLQSNWNIVDCDILGYLNDNAPATTALRIGTVELKARKGLTSWQTQRTNPKFRWPSNKTFCCLQDDDDGDDGDDDDDVDDDDDDDDYDDNKYI